MAPGHVSPLLRLLLGFSFLTWEGNLTWEGVIPLGPNLKPCWPALLVHIPQQIGIVTLSLGVHRAA